MRLEDLQAGTRVNGLDPAGPASVESVKWFGEEAVRVTFLDAKQQVATRLDVVAGKAPAMPVRDG